MIRNAYLFARPLSEDEATLLAELIAWRRGSRLIENESGIVGCRAHEDDLCEFQAKLRERGIRLKVTFSDADPE